MFVQKLKNFMEKQVNKNHYFNQKYNHKARWLSYWYQINLVLSTEPTDVLEIGMGCGIVKDYLLKCGKNINTLDIDADLNPDIVGSVINMPIADNKFDCVLAAEVLEHLPFEKFSSCLKEIMRVSRKYAIISLPDSRRTLINFYLKTPLLPPFKLFLKIPSFKKHIFDGQHYWEPGKKRYPFKKINDTITSSDWKIIKSFTPRDVPTKHFYLLKK